MNGAVLVFVATLVAFASAQDCPAYYVRSQDGQSCYRYFNLKLSYEMASELCEMTTPCGIGSGVMGAIASVRSPEENQDLYDLVASFSRDNMMENEIWLGWDSKNPDNWEDGTPAYPHGFSAFVTGGLPNANGWPINKQNPFAQPPRLVPVMRRQKEMTPGRQGPNNTWIPARNGPVWYPVNPRGRLQAFVCKVPIAKYFNFRLPYNWASEFCEMVTPCGNGEAVMGALASVSSAAENREIYDLVASFNQDNVMETEVWLGWNSMNPTMWEDGTPAFPHGFSAFASGPWPINPQIPHSAPPGIAPVMRREMDMIPPRRVPGGGVIPGGMGPLWDTSEVVGSSHAFVCKVPIGRAILSPTQPSIPPTGNPSLPPQQPRLYQ